MSNTDTNEICENCVHFIQREGQCRKYAPRGEGRPWSSVNKKDWCSEFEQKKSGKPSQKDIDTIKKTLDEQIH